jgi:signal transduction histidine kinase
MIGKIPIQRQRPPFDLARCYAPGASPVDSSRLKSWLNLFAAMCGCAMLNLAGVTNGFAAETKRVMILHSFGRDFRPWADYARTIRAELDRQSPWTLSIQDHSLIIGRSDDDNPEMVFVHYLGALGANRPPDLIICLGAPAADFVQRHRGELFPATPMLLTSVEQRRIRSERLTENDAVVAVAHDFPAIFENILRLLPETKTIAVINGASANEKFWLGELQRETRPFESRVKFQWFENTPFQTISKEAAVFPPQTAIFYHLMSVDAAGIAYEGDTALRELYTVANAPIFSFVDSYFGAEVVGGPMFSVLDGSKLAAAAAIRILGGEKPGAIEVPPLGYATPKYDWRQLQRWQITESLLPPGSAVHFRDPSAWNRYRTQIVLVSLLILIQGAMIAGLLHERRRRQLAEVQLRQRLTELAHANRFAMAGELTASIAHELNQPLGAILTNSETLDAMLQSPTPDLAELKAIAADISRDDKRASDVIRHLRSLLKRYPLEFNDVDFNDPVRDAVEFLTVLANSRSVDLSSSIAAIPLPVKGNRIQLEQVVLNLIINAMDAMSQLPGGQRKLMIATKRIEDFADVSVSDSGPGIPPDKLNDIFTPFFSTKEKGMGIGLSIARTIVEAHRGRIWAENQAGGGAVFHVRLPMAL